MEGKYLIDELREIRGLKEDIIDWEERLKRMESAAERTTARIQDGSKGQTTNDCVGDAVASLMDLRDKLLQKVVHHWERVLDVEEYVDKQRKNYRRVLRLWYLEGQSWDQIGDLMGYTPRWCQEILKHAEWEIRNITIRNRCNSVENVAR